MMKDLKHLKTMIIFASKFSEAELNFEKIELAAKSAIMTSYCLQY